MSAVTVVGVTAAAIVGLELLSRGASFVLARVFRSPVPTLRALLDDQTAKVDRLANAEGVRPRIHPVLGWDYAPGFETPSDTLNAMGLRATKEYDPEPPAGVRRVAAYGDSFVYCGEVSDELSWPARIEAGWRAEVLNHGVGGYGPDQVYLRYLDEGDRLRPDAVLVGFIGVMATRVPSRYRRFQDPGDGPWFKPRYVMEEGGLRLVPTPVGSREDALRLLADPGQVAEAGIQDYWYNPAVYEHSLYRWSATYRLAAHFVHRVYKRYLDPDRIHRGQFLNTKSETFEILVRLHTMFRDAVRANGATMTVVMFPTRRDLELFGREGVTSYQPLLDRLREEGLAVVDLADPLSAFQGPIRDLFAPGGHYSVAANELVAEAVAGALSLERKRP